MVAINWGNMTDLSQLPARANVTSVGTFWVGMLQMIWIILFLLLLGAGFEAAILVSSFLALILALFLAYMGLVAWVYVIQFTGIILFMFLYITWSGRKR